MSASPRANQICAFCPGLCRFACPIEEAEGREAASPRFMVALRHHLDMGLLPWSDEVAAALTFCDGCGACTAVCEHDQPVHELLLEARREARAREHEPAAWGRIAESLAAGRGPAGRPLEGPLREVRPARLGAGTELLLWPSDRALERGPEALDRSCTFLELQGVEFALPAPDAYVPSPRGAREVGAAALEADLTRRLRRALTGYSRVVFEDPADRGLAGPGPEALALWQVGPPQGLRLPPPTRYTLAATSPPGDFADLTRALGLEALTGPGGLHLASGARGLLDLVQPELAARLRERTLARAGGEAVLAPDPFTAAWLGEGGGRVRELAALRPRELP